MNPGARRARYLQWEHLRDPLLEHLKIESAEIFLVEMWIQLCKAGRELYVGQMGGSSHPESQQGTNQNLYEYSDIQH